MEFLSKQRLGVVVSYHFVGRTVADGQVTLLLLISDKEVPDSKVSGPLASTLAAICFQQNGTLVVLKQGILFDIVPLGLEESISP